MPEPLVLVESRPDGVTLLRLNRPPLNPLSTALLRELEGIADGLAADPSVKAVVLTGSEKAFAAGADVSEFTADGAARGRERGHPGGARRARRHPASGDRGDQRLRARRRVRARARRVTCASPPTPPASASPRSSWASSPAAAAPSARRGSSGRRGPRSWSGAAGTYGPRRRSRIGLVDRVVPAAEVLDTALEWAASLASGAVVAMGIAKRAVDRGLDGSLSDGLDLEAEGFVEVFGTDDAAVGIRSFLDDGPGKATFSGSLARRSSRRIDCAAAALMLSASAGRTKPAFTALSVAAFHAFTNAACDG